MNQYLWKIGGEAGFGIMTTGLTLSKIAARQGYQVLDYVEYPSLIRGGHNAYEVAFDAGPVTSIKESVDMLVCLNLQTYEIHKNQLAEGAYVLYDSGEKEPEYSGPLIGVPFRKIITELNGSMVMKNTVALAASLALMGVDLQVLNSIIEQQFARKGASVITFNKTLAQKGYERIVNHFPQYIKPIMPPRTDAPPSVVMTGNDAFSFGAVAADCRYYAAYPMTPSSSVLATLAGWQQKTGIVVRHSEDEIAVINSALGASFAGVRAAVGTSGGGFALMVEAVSLAGVTETPIVIFLAQRAGPATGMPTWTEAGDLLFAVHSGHGEFPKIVLAPSDHQEMFEMTQRAFEYADVYQTPVIVLSDMYLSESHATVPQSTMAEFVRSHPVKRGKTVSHTDQSPYYRYKPEPDGISERLIPGQKGVFFQANSYEHDRTGHTTEAADIRVEQVDKRARKTATFLAQDFCAPRVYGNVSRAKYVFVSYGSTKGAILEAMRQLEERNVPTALIHFTYMYPMDRDKVRAVFSDKKNYILIENNSHAQLGQLLRQQTGIDIGRAMLKYDGRPIHAHNIVADISLHIS